MSYVEDYSERDGYMSRKMRAFKADCIARIHTALPKIPNMHKDPAFYKVAVWFFALGYINGRMSEVFHAVNPAEFADTVQQEILKEIK